MSFAAIQNSLKETPGDTAVSLTPEEVTRIREDFPVLKQQVHGKPLVYLDNGATTQKPSAVIERIHTFYAEQNGTVRRGVYKLSEQSTRAFDAARKTVADFINAPTPSEVIFTSGTTEAINLVASSYGRAFFKPGDEVIISAMEHHANIVPWQLICEQTGAVLRVIPMNDAGELILEEFDALLSDKTKFVAVTHVSNALGTINPVKTIIDKAHVYGVPVLVDGAQAASHEVVDVQALDCDFYAFSGHKIYGPTGVGVLYGKMKHLEAMPPYQSGGDMILSVSFEKTTFAKPPAKFEAGTPPIAQVIGLGAAIEYVQSIGMARIATYEAELLAYATEKAREIPELTIIGNAAHKAAILSFTLKGVHPHDIGTLLDREGVAVRAGHHCAQPVMTRFNVPATARASFSFYNTREEIDTLMTAIRKVLALFA